MAIEVVLKVWAISKTYNDTQSGLQRHRQKRGGASRLSNTILAEGAKS